MRDLGTPVYAKKFFEQIIRVPKGIFYLQSAKPTEDYQCGFHDWVSELHRIKLGGISPRRKTSARWYLYDLAIDVLCSRKRLWPI